MSCAVASCDRPIRLAGLCGAHHQRLLRHGDVRAEVPLRGQKHPDGHLWCSACSTWKSPAAFYCNASTKSGYDGVCAACIKARREAAKVHRAIVQKAWRDANRDRINARKRAAYYRNPKASNEAGKLWRQRNPDRLRQQIRAQNAARYARQKNAPGTATSIQIAAGSNWPANLRPSCSSCNRSKSATWPFAKVA